jgi:flavin-dependent dehydrogenase
MPEFHVLKALLPGGLYLTPLANGLVNVNMVMRLDFVAKNNINLNERFWDVINTHPILKKRFSTQNLVGKLQGSSLSFGTIKRPVSGNGYVLVGDAAGLIDLLSANGICNAVASAEIAAEVIADPSTNYAAPHRYDAVLNAKLQNELMLGRLVSPFLGNPKYFGVIESVLNFIASRAQGGTALSQLLYHPDIGQLLRSPSFYKQMVWG